MIRELVIVLKDDVGEGERWWCWFLTVPRVSV